MELAEPDDETAAETVRSQKEFAAAHGCKYGIAAANGTAMLEMGVRAMDFDVGDEIIVPAYTYVASATCALQNNLVPIFVDSGRAESVSGLWHHRHRRPKPFRNTVVRIPGPSGAQPRLLRRAAGKAAI